MDWLELAWWYVNLKSLDLFFCWTYEKIFGKEECFPYTKKISVE